ncbi:MAG: hypothetical protein DRJ67_07515 [Thermoprotei archaeon]|nr:MAG: hypothetical protein DRJ67_07515 [Thermoprotei archaeon]
MGRRGLLLIFVAFLAVGLAAGLLTRQPHPSPTAEIRMSGAIVATVYRGGVPVLRRTYPFHSFTIQGHHIWHAFLAPSLPYEEEGYTFWHGKYECEVLKDPAYCPAIASGLYEDPSVSTYAINFDIFTGVNGYPRLVMVFGNGSVADPKHAVWLGSEVATAQVSEGSYGWNSTHFTFTISASLSADAPVDISEVGLALLVVPPSTSYAFGGFQHSASDPAMVTNWGSSSTTTDETIYLLITYDRLDPPVQLAAGDTLTVSYVFAFESGQLFVENWGKVLKLLFAPSPLNVTVTDVNGDSVVIGILPSARYRSYYYNHRLKHFTYVKGARLWLAVGDGAASFSRTAYRLAHEIARVQVSGVAVGNGSTPLSISASFTPTEDVDVTEVGLIADFKPYDGQAGTRVSVLLLYHTFDPPLHIPAGKTVTFTFKMAFP